MIQLTNEHRRRASALAVPGAFYDHNTKSYVVENPSPRAAAAIMTLFPEALVAHPELIDIRNRDYGNARPYDFATEMGITLDAGDLGSKRLYSWQDTDAGYLAAIMKRDGGAFVGWDRGLGKTLVTAAFIKATGARRSLVVSRNDAKEPVWKPELEQALPDHQIVILPNQAKKREALIQAIEVGDYDDKPLVLVIHYEAIRVIAGDLTKDDDTVIKGGGNGWKRLGHWDLMVYDEGHRLASYNPNSRKNTQMGRALAELRRLYVTNAINLTGSGIMNHPGDMFGQLHYLFPKIYRAKWADWMDRYVDILKVDNRNVPIGFKVDRLPELRRELGVFMVYRKKSEVMDLPPLIHQNIELELYPEQRRVYDDMRDQLWSKLEEGGINAVNVMDQMNKLRQIATWWPGVPSVKLDFVMSELEEEPDEQFVVFTWYKAPGRALAERIGDGAVVVDGDVPIKRRNELLRQHKEGKARVLIGSIATLGESLNLQYMHEAIRLDRAWNPEANGQTIDRLHRQGQQERVTLRDLWSKSTVDTLRVRPNLASKESLRKAVFG